MNEFSFKQLIQMVNKKYRHDKDFTEYCLEDECYNYVESYGMFCLKHRSEAGN